MKYILSILSSITFVLTASLVSAEDSKGICTMEYAPVCAKVQVQCIKAPCYPVYKTFSNKCVMSNESAASLTHTGACTQFEEGNQAIMSEGLKASLQFQFDNFINKMNLLEDQERKSRLDAIVGRLDLRLSALPPYSNDLIIQMRNDRLKAIYLFVKNLVNTEISSLNDGKTYIYKDPQQCAVVRYLCIQGKVPFSDDTGCGCKNQY